MTLSKAQDVKTHDDIIELLISWQDTHAFISDDKTFKLIATLGKAYIAKNKQLDKLKAHTQLMHQEVMLAINAFQYASMDETKRGLLYIISGAADLKNHLQEHDNALIERCAKETDKIPSINSALASSRIRNLKIETKS